MWKEKAKFTGASILGCFLASGIANLFGVDIDDEIAATFTGINMLKKEIDEYQLEYGENIKKQLKK